MMLQKIKERLKDTGINTELDTGTIIIGKSGSLDSVAAVTILGII